MPETRRAAIVQAAQAASRVSHPGLATLYEVGEDHGASFLAFEYVDGRSVRNTVAGQPIHPRRAVDLGIQMADAVAEAHANGLTHGRLSPDTVMISARGHAKIVKMGLARWLDGGDTASFTAEQNVRADIAALGATLAEMLNGAPLPPGSQTPIPTHIPPELVRVVGRALASRSHDPAREAEGYSNAALLAADLRTVAAQFAERTDSVTPPRARGLPSGPPRQPAWMWPALVAAVVLVVVVLWLVSGAS
jgi:serine/threonine-protein kinase